jgi:hypothetical protein
MRACRGTAVPCPYRDRIGAVAGWVRQRADQCGAVGAQGPAPLQEIGQAINSYCCRIEIKGRRALRPYKRSGRGSRQMGTSETGQMQGRRGTAVPCPYRDRIGAVAG